MHAARELKKIAEVKRIFSDMQGNDGILSSGIALWDVGRKTRRPRGAEAYEDEQEKKKGSSKKKEPRLRLEKKYAVA